jgi:uncharacterized membrane protein YdjX (TVP38/TMEM64 family)
MSVIKNTKNALTDPKSQVHWVKLVIALAGVIALSFGLARLLEFLRNQFSFDLYQHGLAAFISVFVTSVLANATVIAPVPFAIAIIASAAQHFNPVLIALAAALGGTLGEMSGYYAGRLGRMIAFPENIIGVKRITYWVEKHGFWAIAVLSFQPIIPFDVGGMIAGAGKMHLAKFLPALFLGKFPKYIIFAYASLGLFNFLPDWITRVFY